MPACPKLRRPCADCPWRRDAKPNYWDPAHFASIYRTCQDDGTHVMACHKAGELPQARQRELVCMGWVRVIGFNAIGVRIAVLRGFVSTKEVHDKGGPKLYRSFDEMMAANRVKPPRRNRVLP